MRKISKEELLFFDRNIKLILSEERLENFGGEIAQYYDNKLLALEVGHKISDIEIFLRNKLDFCLKKTIGTDWIKNQRTLQIIKDKNNTLSNAQTLSSLMLGEVIELIEEYRVEGYMFDLQNLDFKKYHLSNLNYIKDKKKIFFF